MNLGQFLRDNALALLIGALGVWNGYVTGSSETRGKIDLLEKRISAIEAERDRESRVRECNTRIMDQLTAQAGIVPVCAVP